MELKGKIINFLGDSITEGVGVEDIENCRYDHRLKVMLQLKEAHNYGVSGTRLAHQHTPSENPRFDLCFCGRAYDMAKDADVIVVYGGVNDFIHGDAPFGTEADTTPATFCGGVEFLMQLLKAEYPAARTVFMTPAHMDYDGIREDRPSARPGKRSDARPLRDYVDVIVRKGEKHRIPVLDLFETLGIDPKDEAQKAAFTADGLHFNDAGHAVLAQCLAGFLETL